MVTINTLLEKYGESHQNGTNKFIHWLCVPTIVFSLFGLLYAIPFVTERSLFTNWAFFLYVLALLYYFRLSIPMMLGMMLVCGLMILGVHALYDFTNQNATELAKLSGLIFFVAWVGQFIGHKIEGKKPSFLDDLRFLLVGPAWLLSFIYDKLGIKY